jgi:DNA-binding response OmpR family regulator
VTAKRTTTPPRLLVVDDDPRYGQWLGHHLGVFCPDSTVTVLNLAGFQSWCETDSGRDCDILLLTAAFGSSPEDPNAHGLELLRQLRSRPVFPALIALAEEGNELTAVRALQLGAVDYLPKRLLTPERLSTSVRLALRRIEKRVQRKLLALAHVTEEQTKFNQVSAGETWASMTLAPGGVSKSSARPNAKAQGSSAPVMTDARASAVANAPAAPTASAPVAPAAGPTAASAATQAAASESMVSATPSATSAAATAETPAIPSAAASAGTPANLSAAASAEVPAAPSAAEGAIGAPAIPSSARPAWATVAPPSPAIPASHTKAPGASEAVAAATLAPPSTQAPASHTRAPEPPEAIAAATLLIAPKQLEAILSSANAAALQAAEASSGALGSKVPDTSFTGSIVTGPAPKDKSRRSSSSGSGAKRTGTPAPPVTAEFIPGYIIKMKIGESEKAVVYLATSISLGANVALKVSKTLRDDTAGRQFLEREYTAIIAIRDPLVVQIYDYGVHAGFEYLAMEYLLRGDLKARMQAGLKEAEALRYVEQIAAALRVVHNAGLLHRDLKPPNVMLRDNDEVALIDFGLARALDGSTPSTRTGVLRGSPYYMSPEQALGEQLDVRSDFYSLGIMFYEMLTGRKPYTGATAMEVLQQHVNSPLPPLPHSLARYEAFLHKLAAKNRNERFGKADEIIAAISELRAAMAQDIESAVA